MIRHFAWVWVAGSVLAALAGCGGGDAPPAASIETPATEAAVTETTATSTAARPAKPKPKENLYPEVIIHTSAGQIHVRLNAAKAPVTVDNFLANYARRGFYDDTIVHYVAAKKMIVAGGYSADFQAKEPRSPIKNEAHNGLTNKRGTLAMVRDAEYSQTATSQFFINVADNPEFDHRAMDVDPTDPEAAKAIDLNYGYCVFGEVIAGMEVVDAIAAAAVHDQGDFVSTPVEPIVIQSVEQVK